MAWNVRAGNASSASFVSCMQSTSGWHSSSHASTRASRALSEFTFHVAIRIVWRIGVRLRRGILLGMAISAFPVPAVDDLPDDLRARINEVAAKTGFVPNVFLALAHRPAELRAFIAYHDAVMERDDGLSRAEREMIVVATSAANDCPYCVVAHGAILRIRAKDPLIADQVAVNHRKADLPPRHRAMLDFAVLLATRPGEVGEAERERLRSAGFDDDEIWDIGAVTALFALANRMAHVTDLRPNAEFYAMGREDRTR